MNPHVKGILRSVPSTLKPLDMHAIVEEKGPPRGPLSTPKSLSGIVVLGIPPAHTWEDPSAPTDGPASSQTDRVRVPCPN